VEVVSGDRRPKVFAEVFFFQFTFMVHMHLKYTSWMLKMSNTPSLFIEKVGNQSFLWRFFLAVTLRYICIGKLMKNNTLVHPFSSAIAIFYNKITLIEHIAPMSLKIIP
jgi:hypothetical protein